MLRMNHCESVHQAKWYYTHGLRYEHLDHKLTRYYADEQEWIGQWCGQAAARMGLSGKVDQAAFEALCENRHPATGQRLTSRTKAGRRIGADFNFHCPKSVSVVHALTGDDRIVDAFRQSVAESMAELEAEAKTRVRKKGADDDRLSGNLVWGEFIHFTARPVNGHPDPHLHAHCFVFNSTWDEVEGCWKAAQLGDIFRDKGYFQAAFHARLAGRLGQLGYETRRTEDAWEIAGIPQSLIEKFSQRHALIEAEAARRGITDEDEKSKLVARSREAKVKISRDELLAEWKTRLTDAERAALEQVRSGAAAGPRIAAIRPEDAVAHALSHSYERASVKTDRQLIAEALRYGVGHVDAESIKRQLAAEDLIVREASGRRWCTTRQVLAEEREMVEFVKESRGTCSRLGAPGYQFAHAGLSDEQKSAVRHAIGSFDRVIAISGGAGTGKTTMMREAVTAIEAGGHQVFTFAPSADASRGVLRAEGFGNAETIAHLLQNEKLHASIQGQVLWIDEAGLLSTPQMREVFALAHKCNCRVILSGDTAQHRAVQRGDALRILREHAGLPYAGLSTVRRQRHEAYRKAVEDLQNDRIVEGFAKLNAMGAIREVPTTDRYRHLAEAYVDCVTAKKSALVVSPSHAEGEKATDLIRETLKDCRQLERAERAMIRLVSTQWSEAERRDGRNYREGLQVQFHQHAPGFEGGQRYTVTGSDGGSVHVEDAAGHPKALPLEAASRFSVFEARVLHVAAGDRVRITQNAKTTDGKHRLNNGALYTVKKIEADGSLRLDNGWKLNRDFGHLSHGYCVTSYIGQGKTVDEVFVAQSSLSLAASNKEGFLVSVSRGRDRVAIFTDNRNDLLDAVTKSSARPSALDLAQGALAQKQAAQLRRQKRVRETSQHVARLCVRERNKHYQRIKLPESEVQTPREAPAQVQAQAPAPEPVKVLAHVQTPAPEPTPKKVSKARQIALAQAKRGNPNHSAHLHLPAPKPHLPRKGIRL